MSTEQDQKEPFTRVDAMGDSTDSRTAAENYVDPRPAHTPTPRCINCGDPDGGGYETPNGDVGPFCSTCWEVLSEAFACSFGQPCHVHGHDHGAEAEELRSGVERLIEESGKRVYCDDLRAMLDEVDARDSLAWREKQAVAKDSAGSGSGS